MFASTLTDFYIVALQRRTRGISTHYISFYLPAGLPVDPIIEYRKYCFL